MKTNPVLIFLESVCYEKVSKIIMYLKKYSPGWDIIQWNVRNDTSYLLLLPLTHLLNLSITQGVFPDEPNIAKVIPILKSGDSTQIGNYYRPFSVLPFFLNSLWTCYVCEIILFYKKYDLLYKYQFNFRQSFGREIALVFNW